MNPADRVQTNLTAAEGERQNVRKSEIVIASWPVGRIARQRGGNQLRSLQSQR